MIRYHSDCLPDCRIVRWLGGPSLLYLRHRPARRVPDLQHIPQRPARATHMQTHRRGSAQTSSGPSADGPCMGPWRSVPTSPSISSTINTIAHSNGRVKGVSGMTKGRQHHANMPINISRPISRPKLSQFCSMSFSHITGQPLPHTSLSTCPQIPPNAHPGMPTIPHS